MGKGELELERHQPPAATAASAATDTASTLESVVAPVAGLVAAWIAAGSVGLLGHPLRHALTLFVIGAAVVLAWPKRGTAGRRLAIWIAGIAAAVLMSGSSLVPVNVLAVALAMAAVASVRPDAERFLRAAAMAAAVLGIYRLALTSIPSLWMAADSLGGTFGRLAGSITGQPLSVGPTFAGLDFLVTMTALLAAFVVERPARPLRFAVWGIVGIVIAQLLYLIILSKSQNILSELDDWRHPPPPPTLLPGDTPPPLSLAEVTKKWFAESVAWTDFLPWNLPFMAALLQSGLAAAMLARMRSARRVVVGNEPPQAIWLRPAWIAAAAGVTAALIPIATVLSPNSSSLDGKKVVAYEKGYLNWMKPEYGQYGRLMIGMYGMFGPFVESLGGQFVKSPALSESDLEGADLLVLFYPTSTLDKDQLQRVQDYVKRGGSMLLLCDHSAGASDKDEDRFQVGESTFNEILRPTSIHVGFDAAEFEIGGWLESYEAMAHPTTAGIDDHRNLFGCVIGASLEIQSPARPMLIGRWGYSDVGDKGSWPSMLGNQRYDSGERLGDLVLVAEQPWGNGRIIVFGDTSTLGNGIVVGSHPFAARLLAYLADKDAPTPQSALRQLIGLLLAAAAIVMLLLRPSAMGAATVAIALSAALAICVSITAMATEILPDGRSIAPFEKASASDAATSAGATAASVTAPSKATPRKPDGRNRLAYIDAAHLGAYSDESNRPDGIFALQHALMREELLVLQLYDLTYERLSRAGLLASIGPQRPFSAGEREAIKQFVEEGGIFILMAGYDRSAASRELLADFGFAIGAVPPWLPKGTEPAPLGHFKAPYFKQGNEYETFVRFRAAWPVECFDPKAQVIASGIAEPTFNPDAGRFETDKTPTLPVIVVRDVGKGKVVVIGDTEFATNRNLENEDGKPIEGLYENIDFWRWFLPKLRGTTPWLPPKPVPIVTPEANPAVPAPTPTPSVTQPPGELAPLPPSIDAGLPLQPGKPKQPPLPLDQPSGDQPNQSKSDQPASEVKP